MRLSIQILAVLTIALFVTIAVFGLHNAMAIDSRGNMSPCPLMANVASLCKMNIMAHLSGWQSLLAAATPATTLLLLSAIAFLLFSFSLKNLQEDPSAKTEFSSIKHRNLDALVFNPLRLAFRRGILNPKIYEPVAIL